MSISFAKKIVNFKSISSNFQTKLAEVDAENDDDHDDNHNDAG